MAERTTIVSFETGGGDDKAELLPMVIYLRGDVDKDNPRVEITVCDIDNYKDKKELDTKLTLLKRSYVWN